MKGNKPHKGNQLNGCHSGPYNTNRSPSEPHKVPSKQLSHQQDRFFQKSAKACYGNRQAASLDRIESVPVEILLPNLMLRRP